MRFIKMRVWSGKMWYDGNDALRYLCAKNPDSTDIELTYLDHDYIINLSTGLKDKNGVEIFEGDVLGTRPQRMTRLNGAVDRRYTYPEWYDVQAVEWGTHDDWSDGYEAEPGRFVGWNVNPDQLCDVEVIGNIYENAELLQK